MEATFADVLSERLQMTPREELSKADQRRSLREIFAVIGIRIAFAWHLLRTKLNVFSHCIQVEHQVSDPD